MKEDIRNLILFVGSGWRDTSSAEQRDLFEDAVETMLTGWLQYAMAHRAEYGSSIGEDGVLGPEWQRIGAALLGLLNGKTGSLDCGRVDGWIRWRMEEAGFDGADE